jgi:hypothetical protein
MWSADALKKHPINSTDSSRARFIVKVEWQADKQIEIHRNGSSNAAYEYTILCQQRLGV